LVAGDALLSISMPGIFGATVGALGMDVAVDAWPPVISTAGILGSIGWVAGG
jgi:hypothetical protein